LAKIHEHALIDLLTARSSLESTTESDAGGDFFVEALAPIEDAARRWKNKRLNR
jgi:hypothetical protein